MEQNPWGYPRSLVEAERADRRYFLDLLPEQAGEVWHVIQSHLDRYETAGSRMFDELPGQDFIRRLTDQIFSEVMLEEPGEGACLRRLRQALGMLILWEMQYRRARYRRRSYGMGIRGNHGEDRGSSVSVPEP